MKMLAPWRTRKSELSRRGGDEDAFSVFRSRMNEMFDEMFGDSPAGDLFLTGDDWTRADGPSFEVSESDDELRVKAELPGIAEKDVEVTIDNGTLLVRGEKRAERDEKKRRYHVSEVSYGSFERSIPLPAGADVDAAEATFDQGVLTLVVPKKEVTEAASKRIPLSSG